jgi:hypothetical protein
MNVATMRIYAVGLYSMQNSNLVSTELSLGLERRLIRIMCNFTEIWQKFEKFQYETVNLHVFHWLYAIRTDPSGFH